MWKQWSGTRRLAVLGLAVGVLTVGGAVGFSIAVDSGGSVPDDQNPLKKVSCAEEDTVGVVDTINDFVAPADGTSATRVELDEAVERVTRQMFGTAAPPAGTTLVRRATGSDHRASFAVEDDGLAQAEIRFEEDAVAGWLFVGWTACSDWAEAHGLLG